MLKTIIYCFVALCSLNGIQSSVIAQSVAPPKTGIDVQKLQMKGLSGAKDLFEQRLKRSQTRLQSLMNELKETQSRFDQKGVSPASFAEVMGLLETQRVELMIELAGIEAKRAKLIESAKSGEDKTGEPAKDMLVILEKYVANQNVIVQQIEAQHKLGTVTGPEVLQAKQLLIQAQLRLAEAKQSIYMSSRDQNPANWLTEVELERIEKRARLTKVEMLLSEIKQLRPYVQKASQLDRHMDSELNEQERFGVRINELEEEMEVLKPVISPRNE